MGGMLWDIKHIRTEIRLNFLEPRENPYYNSFIIYYFPLSIP